MRKKGNSRRRAPKKQEKPKCIVTLRGLGLLDQQDRTSQRVNLGLSPEDEVGEVVYSLGKSARLQPGAHKREARDFALGIFHYLTNELELSVVDATLFLRSIYDAAEKQSRGFRERVWDTTVVNPAHRLGDRLEIAGAEVADRVRDLAEHLYTLKHGFLGFLEGYEPTLDRESKTITFPDSIPCRDIARHHADLRLLSDGLEIDAFPSRGGVGYKKDEEAPTLEVSWGSSRYLSGRVVGSSLLSLSDVVDGGSLSFQRAQVSLRSDLDQVWIAPTTGLNLGFELDIKMPQRKKRSAYSR